MSQEALDGLFRLLDSDPGIARQKYEKIKNKLIKFFEWRGCGAPDELAAETIDGVARRLLRGARPRAFNPYVYFHRAAMAVLKADWTEQERRRTPGGGSLDTGLPAGAVKPYVPGAKGPEPEQLRQCLQACLIALPPESLELIVQYHSLPGGLSDEVRKELARSLGIPQNVLRMRAFMVRSSLEVCVSVCLSAVTDK